MADKRESSVMESNMANLALPDDKDEVLLLVTAGKTQQKDNYDLCLVGRLLTEKDVNVNVMKIACIPSGWLKELGVFGFELRLDNQWRKRRISVGFGRRIGSGCGMFLVIFRSLGKNGDRNVFKGKKPASISNYCGVIREHIFVESGQLTVGFPHDLGLAIVAKMMGLISLLRRKRLMFRLH
ncbi:hypothetical protein GH714_013583 [Hevea brasiliensis]|uniref:Uncharacterized protein n=1 Tax=Hevea brasiliensis TaxID=3981 RepID=A0A6A6KNF7_HEVBR|nr:hypothetical protein GH714_013583 [Hevea brasiliensis]